MGHIEAIETTHANAGATPKQKLLCLLDIFRSFTDEYHALNATELISLLAQQGIDAERKGIYRDIDQLRAYGLDIGANKQGYYLASREMSFSDIQLLLDAVSASAFIPQASAERITSWLRSQLSQHQAALLTHIPSFRSRPIPQNHETPKTIAVVEQAIALQRRIAFDYNKPIVTEPAATTSFVVSPYSIALVDERYYLIANLEFLGVLTHFRLDKIRHIRMLEMDSRHFSEVCDYRDEFDTEDYVLKSFCFPAPDAVTVRLRCVDTLLGEVFDRFGSRLTIEKQGSRCFLVDVPFDTDLPSWVASCGAQCEVISPEPLRAQMRDVLSAAAAIYRGRE